MIKFKIKNLEFFRDLLFLTIIIGILFGAMLGTFPLEAPDGARYAEIPREMVVTGDYLTPHLNGVKYFEKPPLFYWMQAGAIKTFGLSEWSVHTVNALCAFLLCLMTYVVGRKIYGRRSGIFGSLVLATSALFFALGRIITLDMTLTLFLSIALFSFILGTRAPSGWERQRYMWLMYIASGLAVMTKGLVGLFFPGLIIFAWIAIFNEWRSLKTYCLVTGGILFLLITLPWHILVGLKNPEFFRFYFFEQHFLRYFTPYAGREQPFWFFSAFFLIGFFPWIFFLPEVIKHHLKYFQFWKKYLHFQAFKTEVFLLIWPLVIFLFYNFSDSKLATYILPILPPLALLTGNFFAQTKKISRLAVNICVITMLVLGFGVLSAIHWMDFSKSALSSIHFYLIGISLLIAAVAVYVAYQKYEIKPFFAVLLISTMVFLLSVVPSINISNNKSIKPLIDRILPKLKSADKVVGLGNYYQDLPYYLQRIVMVVDFRGELEFGTQHTIGSNKWMISTADFWKLWKSNQRVFVFVDADSYAKIEKNMLHSRKYLLGKYINTVLFTNTP